MGATEIAYKIGDTNKTLLGLMIKGLWALDPTFGSFTVLQPVSH